jgi:diguanylate cyclase (GGDEF)-like protein
MATPKPTTGMLLDGCFATEAIDSSGEIVDITDMDITTMEEGRGTVNYEHIGEDGGGFGKETVGKVVYVRKIFKESDCETDRQRDYFKRLKGIPFLYGIARLFDAAGHAGAQALAAAIRDQLANDEPILLMWSIEGTTTKKDGNRIAASIARKVALTWKPCNKTAFSGVIADPNAPAGFTKNEPGFVDPEYARLGGSDLGGVVESDDGPMIQLLAAAATLTAVRKALTAGMPSGAPSTLTGGAALQREDWVRGNAMAALRDWAPRPFRRGEFRAFAKARLPEVSEEFLDHFTDVADAYHVKRELQKAIPKTPRVSKVTAPKPVVAAKVTTATPEQHPVLEDISDEDEDLPDELVKDKKGMPRKLAYGTYRGTALKPNVGMVRPTFDVKKGVLHTPAGSFRAYLPQYDGQETAGHYQRLLSHPDTEAAMDHAIGNWSKLHGLLKAGKLPPEVLMHAVMFSQLSPTKPVPVQEIQYARLVDAMDATGIDPRYPGFEDIETPYRNMDSPTRLPFTGREAFATNPAYYQGSKIGPDVDAQGNVLGKPSALTGRRPGELLSTAPLFNDFLGRASQYHKLHGMLTDIMQRHRHNILGAVGEMMNQKQAAQRWENNRRGTVKRGGVDPGAYQGQKIPGLKVKTGLYTWGMMGGGNSVVPDTHFIRNAFGLDVDKDADTIKYLKGLMWRPSNMDNVIGPFNQWYAKNHPAVEYTVNHPKWGSKFATREDALFPSFWRHWLTIQPHERHLGMSNYSEQAGTNHAPYWEGIKPYIDPLLKGDETGADVALRTALVHQQYVKDFGEVPALFLFYHHLVPKLLEAADHRQRFGKDMQFLAKARLLEAGLIDLRKAVSDVLDGPASEGPEVFRVSLKVGEQLHPAGRYMIFHGKLHHLEDYHGVLSSMLPEGDVDVTTVSRLHGLKWSPNFEVGEHQPQPETAEAQPELRVKPVDPPPPPAVFEYHRPGMSIPHLVEFGGSGAALDGKALADDELDLMLSNVNSGLATLRYRHGMVKYQMDDEMFEELLKAMAEGEDPVEYATRTIRDAASGKIPAEELQGRLQEAERIWTKHIFTDDMAEGVGNKYAWEKFKALNRPGTYVSIDGNDFKHVNDTHGHQAGDDAIKGIGAALRGAADKVGNGKLFRSGGDEFVAHFPSFEEAARFGRHVHENLASVPPIAGRHKLSVSMGIGPTYQHADKVALPLAKKGRIDKVTGQRAFAPGHVPNMAHSVMPGAEGPIPLHTETPPRAALPKPSAPAAAAAP